MYSPWSQSPGHLPYTPGYCCFTFRIFYDPLAFHSTRGLNLRLFPCWGRNPFVVGVVPLLLDDHLSWDEMERGRRGYFLSLFPPLFFVGGACLHCSFPPTFGQKKSTPCFLSLTNILRGRQCGATVCLRRRGGGLLYIRALSVAHLLRYIYYLTPFHQVRVFDGCPLGCWPFHFCCLSILFLLLCWKKILSWVFFLQT
jgi:hypothetical protein